MGKVFLLNIGGCIEFQCDGCQQVSEIWRKFLKFYFSLFLSNFYQSKLFFCFDEKRLKISEHAHKKKYFSKCIKNWFFIFALTPRGHIDKIIFRWHFLFWHFLSWSYLKKFILMHKNENSQKLFLTNFQLLNQIFQFFNKNFNLFSGENATTNWRFFWSSPTKCPSLVFQSSFTNFHQVNISFHQSL